MFHKPAGDPAQARTLNLNEELGQVSMRTYFLVIFYKALIMLMYLVSLVQINPTKKNIMKDTAP